MVSLSADPRLLLQILAYLTVKWCHVLSVLPFTLLSLLPELEELEVGNCDSVKTIFDVKCTTQNRLIILPLKKLVLSELPNLETVWNEDPHGILSMQFVQEVYVENCKCLTSVFPPSIVKDFEELKILVVKHCEVLMAIVAEANPAHRQGPNPKLTFPSLTSLTLWDLPKFKHDSIYAIHVATPTFEHLTVGENELKMIMDGEFQGNKFHKLKVLTLCCHIESGVFLEFLQLAPNVKKLVLYSGFFKEIFCLQIPNSVNYNRLLLQLKELRLESLGELVSIGLENSWTEPFVKNLETFKVIRCPSLRSLVSCRVSFSNLISLKVESCDSLSYLFTSSTAKTLAQLKKMKIKECKSIEEIVSKEGEESEEEEEIIFEQLQLLYIEKLDELRCFHAGNFTLSFPSLETIYVIKCSSMKTFSAVNKIDHSIKWYSRVYATPREESDLNSAVRRTCEEEVEFVLPTPIFQ